jgi:hypothetical protein
LPASSNAAIASIHPTPTPNAETLSSEPKYLTESYLTAEVCDLERPPNRPSCTSLFSTAATPPSGGDTADHQHCRKFGKHIQKRQLDIPEYAASFVDYKALKKV